MDILVFFEHLQDEVGSFALDDQLISRLLF